MQFVRDYDFHMDHERSDTFVDNITHKGMSYGLLNDVSFKEFFGLRICKDVFSDEEENNYISEIRLELQDLGKLPLEEDEEFISIFGYSK